MTAELEMSYSFLILYSNNIKATIYFHFSLYSRVFSMFNLQRMFCLQDTLLLFAIQKWYETDWSMYACVSYRLLPQQS